MLCPNAPARPTYSKALALTTVSTLTLLVSAAGSNSANAACTASATLGINFECSGTSTNPAGTTVTNHGDNGTITGDNGNMAFSLLPGSLFTNRGTITVDMDTALNNTAGTDGYQRTRLYGISGADAGSYEVINAQSGVITVTHNGTGRLWGIAGNGDTTSMSVTNAGSISVFRGATFDNVSATALNAHGGALAAVSLDIGAGVYSEEELESFSVTNSGTITASGLLAAGIYSRAGETEIENSGTVQVTGSASNHAFAIAGVSDSGETRTVTLNNSGTITGDILMVGGHAQRWLALSTGMGGTVNARLNINSQYGQLDSEITNSNSITGNLYFGNGTHTLTNEDGGTITGNLDIDQRTSVITGRTCNTSTGCTNLSTATPGTILHGDPAAEEASENSAAIVTANASPTLTYTTYIWGSKDFTFENAGTYTGNFTVLTEDVTALASNPNSISAGTIAGFDKPESSITIKTHIYGEGTESGPLDDTKSGAINGTLKVWDGTNSTLASTTTIAPVIDSLVRSEERYTVATSVFQASPADLPEVEGSALVSWEAGVTGGKLFIEATVADASTISGLSAPGIAAVNGLMNVETEDEDVLAFAGSIQNLASASDVRTAGEQLAPDTSFGTTKTALQLASLYSNAIGQRLTGGLSGQGAAGGTGFAPPSGLGMGSGNTSRYDAPMHLSGSDDGYVAAPGREAAWAQAFGAKLNQDAVSSTGGYDADLYGFMGGYDGSLSSNLRAGVAFGYGNTSISETGVRRGDTTDMDSYNATLYAATRGAGWYLTGQLGYTAHDVATKRVLNAGGLTASATGSHDGDQVTAGAEFGAPLRVAGAVVTPVASLAYNKLDQDSYTERGTAGFALAVESQSSKSLVSGLGVRTSIALGAGSAIEARAIWLHEFEDTNQAVTASFASASNAFTATGASLSADSANLGAGVNLNSGTGYSLQLNYDAYVSDDFIAHAGTGRVRVEF